MKRLGVDVGGTFTDLIYVDDESGQVLVHKLATTPEDPSRGTVQGIQELAAQAGVDTGALELFHIASRGVGQLRDRELARRNVREQLEQPVERFLLVLGELCREEQDLGVDLLQDAFELVVVSDADDVLDAELMTALRLLGECMVVVGREHDGVRSGRERRVLAARTPA